VRPTLPLTGGCQCGRHRYRVTAMPLTLYACHCTDCQTQSGSAFGLSMTVARSALELNADDLGSHERPAASGNVVRGRFCRGCGTRILHEPSRRPETANIKPGTLDDTSWVRPVAHIWLESAQPWFVPPADTLARPRQPEDREALNRRFRALVTGSEGGEGTG